jgi:hypothetical protein
LGVESDASDVHCSANQAFCVAPTMKRKVDYTHGIHLPVGVDVDLFAGFEALDVDAPVGIDGFGDALDAGMQPRGAAAGCWANAGIKKTQA